ncbi:MAG TPA: pyrroline-5-carboxylate reductase [Phycisphaerae bacterium]|nr:pyrroline-5-carboxylate reductase [Phycisphaerae bacterium]
MTTQYEIGIIGAGNAAEGIADGVLRKSVLFNDRMIASDPAPERRQVFAERFHIAVTDDNRRVVQHSYIIILAVKPQIWREVLAGFVDLIRDDHLIVSIMAGVSTRSIEERVPHVRARVVRVMPNLPIHVGAGMAGVHAGRNATEADRLHAQRIFDAGGRSLVINDEPLMDAVTAVSGTGPAYFYYFVEALIEAGVRMGLSEQYASLMAKHACYGAARMLLETGERPADLRRKVTSPGGTTQAAVENMRETRLYENIVAAAMAARQRSEELGQ